MKKIILLFFVIIISILLFLGFTAPENTFNDYTLLQEEEVKFCLVGDLGMDSKHQFIIAESLKRENCHRIVFLGDLVYPRGIESLSDPDLHNKFLAYYLPLFENNPELKILLLLGNHDHQGNISAWLDLSKKDPRFFFPDFYYLVDYGGLCLVAFDTDFYYYGRPVKDMIQQTFWFSGIESELEACKVEVALGHHPYRSEASTSKKWKGAEGGLKYFLDSYIIGEFDAYIAGHVHAIADGGEVEGTKLFISGTGGENRGAGDSGFLIMSWRPKEPGNIKYRFQKIDIEGQLK